MAPMLTLENPRARFSRTENRATLISCLGETLWYLSSSNKLDMIEYYIPRYREFTNLSRKATIAPGAYGPRVFSRKGKFFRKGKSQIEYVIESLDKKTDTRQAVIQIFDSKDLGKKDVPCTCTLQFLARDRKLHMLTSMRSNDAYFGLPHDVFAFTMFQEIVARSISHELGLYHHAVGSLHLYDKQESRARDFLNEGWQNKIAMPEMPDGDPWPSIKWLLDIEAQIRLGKGAHHIPDSIDSYWADLAHILRIKKLLVGPYKREIVKEKNAMSSKAYDEYIRARARASNVSVDEPQLSFESIQEEKAKPQKGRT